MASHHKGHSGSRRNRHANFSAGVETLDDRQLIQFVSDLDHDPFLLLLDSVQDPHNLGACLRSADAAGVDAVVVPKDRSAPVSSTVKAIACGAAERMPIARVTNLSRTMRDLKEAGVWLFGTADQAEKSIYDADLTGPLGLVMGAEGTGLRRLVQESCDVLIAIPMQGKVECLNVSVATGVCLFEAVRQRLG